MHHVKLIAASALLAFQAIIAPEKPAPDAKAPPSPPVEKPAATSPTPAPADTPRPTLHPDPVSAVEILPLRVIYPSMRDTAGEEIMLVGETEVLKQRHVNNEWVTVSTMPLDRPALERVLAGAHKEDFRGIVRYSNRYLRDACPRRIVTPLGEIEESGVVDAEDDKAFPQAILRLKPLYQLIDNWRTGTDELGNPLQAGPGLRQPLPEQEITETLFRLNHNQTVDATILCRALVSGNTTLRALAAQRLGEMDDLTAVQDLILALKDDSQHVGANYPKPGMDTTRWWANESLKKLTGHDVGYRWDAPLAEREQAIQKWTAWMKGNALK